MYETLEQVYSKSETGNDPDNDPYTGGGWVAP